MPLPDASKKRPERVVLVEEAQALKHECEFHETVSDALDIHQRITHRPTGLSVEGDGRSPALLRYFLLGRLRERIDAAAKEGA